MAKKSKRTSTFQLTANGHEIVGEKRGGTWTFICHEWPELANQFTGAKDLNGVTAAFMARALAGCMKITVAKPMKDKSTLDAIVHHRIPCQHEGEHE
jgi:hypothetical protein